MRRMLIGIAVIVVLGAMLWIGLRIYIHCCAPQPVEPRRHDGKINIHQLFLARPAGRGEDLRGTRGARI